MVKGILDFINYWYFRYLLVTELYMVEKWERVMFHIVLFILLTVLSLFNTTVLLSIISWITEPMFIPETLQEMTSGAVHGEL